MNNKIQTELLKCNVKNIKKASNYLKKGNLIVFPTETVFGIGGDAFSDEAIKKIFEIKKRPSFNPLIVHLKDKDIIKDYAIINKKAEILINNFMPGPLTLILPLTKNSKISKFVTAGLNSIAVRVPSHKIIKSILEEFGRPIAAPSANISGKPSSTRSNDAYNTFKGLIPCIMESKAAEIGLESTVIGFDEDCPVLLRYGAIEVEKIQEILGEKVLIKNSIKRTKKVLSPGQTLRHYSPTATIRLNATKAKKNEVFLGFGKLPKDVFGKNLSKNRDLNEAASNLYSSLIDLDELCLKLNKKQIAVASIPNIGIGKTINDRLRKASKKN